MAKKNFRIIAIDGPGGVGKSSLAKLLSERLGYYFLSTGLIYRAMVWFLAGHDGGEGSFPWDTESTNPPDEAAIAPLEDFTLRIDAEGLFWVNGAAVVADLHAEEISRASSIVSTIPAVRERANRIQRETVARIEREGTYPGVILEGRDIGTVVFPDASHKFFVTASEQVRAERRFLEKKAENPELTHAAVLEGLRERDHRDSTREAAPLKAAADAIEIDTSELSLREVVEKVLAVVGR